MAILLRRRQAESRIMSTDGSRIANGCQATKTTKLLFFVTEDWYFVSHRLPLALAAKSAGYDVSVVTRVREMGDTIRAAGLRLVPFENSRSGMNPLNDFWMLSRLIKLYRRERPGIVHHVAMKPVLYGTIAARLAGRPHVVNALAGMGWLFTNSAGGVASWLKTGVCWVLGRLLQSGMAIVQNYDDLDLLVQLGVQESRIRIVGGSGVDLGRFTPYPEPAGVPILVLPARLLWDKGVGEYVAAARLLKQEGIAARFMLAGAPDKSNPSSLSPEQIAAWVKEGIVEYPGWVADMPRLFANCHIVCLPSYREGMPKSLIEAAAAGRPIVTTDTPGCREIVRHGENGLLVPPRDATALAGALRQLILDRSLRESMGKRGREIAKSEFSIEKVAQLTLAIYRELSS